MNILTVVLGIISVLAIVAVTYQQYQHKLAETRWKELLAATRSELAVAKQKAEMSFVDVIEGPVEIPWTSNEVQVITGNAFVQEKILYPKPNCENIPVIVVLNKNDSDLLVMNYYTNAKKRISVRSIKERIKVE